MKKRTTDDDVYAGIYQGLTVFLSNKEHERVLLDRYMIQIVYYF